jgi:hypothetical protein
MVKHGVWLKSGSVINVNEAVQRAVLAESAGWDGVFVSDDPWEGWSDPWTVLAAIASQTERITLGTWITPVPAKQPWELAHTLAALDQLSNGRVLLGTGLGLKEYYETFEGNFDGPALGRKYDEALEIMVGLWTGEEYSFAGEFFTLSAAKLPVVPVQKPRIPIVTAAWWPNKKPFRRGARWDGIMPTWPACFPGVDLPWKAEGDFNEQMTELISYYLSHTDTPGEIIVDLHSPGASSNHAELAQQLGITWFMTTYNHQGVLAPTPTLEQISQGPPEV